MVQKFVSVLCILGSHAAMTCHIAVMRHRISGVVSIGHFDNFCCWQFGENSSAHRDGLDIMVKEISALSCDNSDDIGGFHTILTSELNWSECVG